jgi:hypothetical protein
VTLTEGNDYNLSCGKLTLFINGTNNVPTNPGDWTVTVSADNYDDAQAYLYVEPGAVDPNAAKATLVLEDAPFMVGHRTTVKMDLVDRFGNKVAYAPVKCDFTIIDNDATYIEPYKVIDENGVARLVRPTPLHPDATPQLYIPSDENATVTIPMQIPGYVDLNDGFEMVLKTESDEVIETLTYSNDVTTPRPVEWKSRFGVKHLGLLASGEPKYEIANTVSNSVNAKMATDGSVMSFIATALHDVDANRDNALFLAAFDTNGVARWQRMIGVESNKTVILSDLRYQDGKLYVSLHTNGTFSSLASESSTGAFDIAYAELNATTGAVITKRAWGDGTNQESLTLMPRADGVDLYFSSIEADPQISRVMHFNDDGSIGTVEDYDLRFRAITPMGNGEIIATDTTNAMYDYNATTQRWRVLNDGRSPGASNYNYAHLDKLWTDGTMRYGLGGARKGFFDETFAA